MFTNLPRIRTTSIDPTTHAAQAANRRGAMLVLIAVMIIGFLIAVAFSVDIAHMHLSRTELRTSTDAAAKAAAQTLSTTLDVNQAIARGQAIALENQVAGAPLIISDSDFEFGRSQADASGRFVFTTSGTPKNSVRVQGRRTANSSSGAVRLIFGNVMGVEFFEPQLSSTATFIERDVVLVVDRSGSMAGPKIADLVEAINVFVQTLSGTPVSEQVGLASYSTTATVDVLLTDNLDAISSQVAAMRAGGATSISAGMEAGRQIMEASRSADFVERTMIVMTDGLHNTGREPRSVARQLANNDVTIHTITFGANADQSRMTEIADIGNGRHFHALNGDQLREIYREIALTLSTMITE